MDAPPQRQCGHPPDRIRQRPWDKGGDRCLECERLARRERRASAPKSNDPRPRTSLGQFVARAPAGAAAPPPPPPDDVEILGEDPLDKTQECPPLSDTLTDIQGHATFVSDTEPVSPDRAETLESAAQKAQESCDLRRSSPDRARPTSPAQETQAPPSTVADVADGAQPDDSVQNGKRDLAAGGKTARHHVRRAEAHLIISDSQEPYSAPGALAFVLAVAREFGIDVKQPGAVYHVGDEVDFLNFSRFLRSPEAPHTPNQEIEAVRDRLRPWYEAIPHLRLCQSNHGDRILRRAQDAGLPSQLLRAHRDVLQAPPGWEWAREWRVQASRKPFLVEHGHHGGQSTAAARQRPAWNGISTTWGHMHAQAGVWHVRTHGQEVWGMCVGSLIDREAIAFEYGKPNTWQPWLGVGVVLDGGRVPILIPYGGGWP